MHDSIQVGRFICVSFRWVTAVVDVKHDLPFVVDFLPQQRKPT